MNYPLISEYIEAIKSAEDNFDKLSHLRPVLADDGNPVMSSGNFAVVFKMTDGKKDYAIKCFTREQEGRAEAYQQIAEYLKTINSTYFVKVNYYPNELFVTTNLSDDTEFPVLQMDWVEGFTLDNYVYSNINNKKSLNDLFSKFIKLALYLVGQPFAHGDLKPDNIIVKTNGDIVLLDYDGMFVPKMKGQKAREFGTPDYRHPEYLTSDFNETADDYAIVILCILIKALIVENSSLFDRVFDDVNNTLKIIESNATNASLLNLFSEYRSVLATKRLNINFFSSLMDNDASILKFKDAIIEYANNGDADAMFNLGCRNNPQLQLSYSNDTINKAIAFNWIKKAAENGHIESQYILACCYRDAEGCDSDIEKSIIWFRKAAEQGHCDAQYQYGLYHFNNTNAIYNWDYKREAVEWFSKAAEQGHLEAIYRLGECYYNGLGVVRNYHEAQVLFEKAAKQGNLNAMCALGECYENGHGVRKNEVQAVKWYKKAAEQGLESGQYNLGRCYYHGIGIKSSKKSAKVWLEKASKQNNKDANSMLAGIRNESLMLKVLLTIMILISLFIIGVIEFVGKESKDIVSDSITEEVDTIDYLMKGNNYYFGKNGYEQNYEEAFKCYQKALKQGDTSAYFDLGYCYEHGQGVAKDLHKAAHFYSEGANKGYMLSQEALGDCYYYGKGVEENYSKASHLYASAANQGLASAQRKLGMCYELGHGVSAQQNEAIRWYMKAANNGDEEAQKRLDSLRSLNIVNDTNDFVSYKEKAQKGDAHAQEALGDCYYNGKGVEQSYSNAFQWYVIAADQGLASAERKLGMCYELGHGVSAIKSEAIRWYKKAANKGDEEALDKLKSLQ